MKNTLKKKEERLERICDRIFYRIKIRPKGQYINERLYNVNYSVSSVNAKATHNFSFRNIDEAIAFLEGMEEASYLTVINMSYE